MAGWSLLLVQASSHLLNQGLAGLYAHTSLTLQVLHAAHDFPYFWTMISWLSRLLVFLDGSVSKIFGDNCYDVMSCSWWYRWQFPSQVFQTAAVLEILHAAVGLVQFSVFNGHLWFSEYKVRSPVMVTFQQVFSRVYVTWAILHLCPPSQVLSSLSSKQIMVDKCTNNVLLCWSTEIQVIRLKEEPSEFFFAKFQI